ncbi:MAG TPA: NAD-dependent deacylase [Ignavibacteriales bacterium]|nr:NAD-dependent deacylase [Ignavibacteriales bacterium]
MRSFRRDFLEVLKEAERVVFFTGAGISAESGISTFRGTDGIWNKLKPEELANFDAFLKNPDRVWEWYQYRRHIIHNSKPNPAHLAIAEMQNCFKDAVVVTQNVDNLHRRAGSLKVYELHGNIERNYCIECRTPYNSPDFASAPEDNKVPRCQKCGGLIRPDIVWFGEMLPGEDYSRSEDAAEKCDVMFAIGTSAVVYPAARIPLLAKRLGAFLVEINLEETELSPMADYVLLGKAGEILPEILQEVKKIKGKTP